MMEPINVPFELINISTIYPMLVMIIGALSILLIDLFTKNSSRSFYTMLSTLFILGDIGIVLSQNVGQSGFFELVLVDGIAILSQVIILAASALFIPLSLTSHRYHEYSYPEFYALFLFMIAGFQFMVSTDNLILILLGLETASLALYTLIAMHNRQTAFEASIKYFTMGAMATGLFAFGSMILYLLTGSLELGKIGEVLVANSFQPMPLVFVAVAFMLAAIGFKVSMVPFHTWTPDVYEGASAVLAGYMSVAPKIAGFIVALRFFDVFVESDVEWVKDILYIMIVVTMTLPNLLALVQEDVKRMLAYSSISHAGFALAALYINTTQATTALFLYWILFLFTNLGSFTMLWVSRHKSKVWHDRFDHPYSKFAGMIKVMPVAAVLMAIFMLSLAGIPPFAVFWGKLYIMSAAVNEGLIILALIMALNSAISAYYYLKLVVYMFMYEPTNTDGTLYMKNASVALKTILGFSAFITVFSVVLVMPLLDFITEYVRISGF